MLIAAVFLLAALLFWPLSFSVTSEGRGLKGEVLLYWRPVPAFFLRGWRLLLCRYSFPGPAALKKEKRAGRKTGGKKREGGMVMLRRLLRAVSFRRFSLSLDLGTGDAAFTCLAAGAIYSLINSLLLVAGGLFGRFPPPPYISIKPEFSEQEFFWRAECIVESRAGNIMLRCLVGFLAVKRGRKR
ncbi:MAG: DUF2953 domain-containing protein [Clostridiales bacterium]|nr:DUF2953 domain-containing protein [Clostridiales bacterium]